MKTLKEYVLDAEEKNRAVGHFNAANIEMLWGIFRVAQRISREVGEKIPVIVGLSEGERSAFGIRQGVLLVKSIREEYDYPLFVNADHSHSLETFQEAVDAGFDAAIIDEADDDLEDNIRVTKEAVEYARVHNDGMLVEGEVGYIGTSSKLLDEIPKDAQVDGKGLVTPEIAARFVEETGVDLFAPAIGNLHGKLKGRSNPRLHIDLISAIRRAAGVPLVLHGGSGVTEEDFRMAIEAGMSTVHVSTEIRIGVRAALEDSLKENTEELAPYRYMKPVTEAVEEVVGKYIRLFWNI
ncbi:MAG: class II fructose-bisphosphate aldolase [Candidatus Paceibacterota bacterium]